MYDIIKQVIISKEYSLPDMIKKIDTIWIQGDITEEQKNELKTLATENAPHDTGNTELLKRILDRVDVLEKEVAILKNDGVEPVSPIEEYPEWIPYDGIHADRYMKDAKVKHNEKKYISLVDYNTWEPGVIGTETVWQLVEE